MSENKTVLPFLVDTSINRISQIILIILIIRFLDFILKARITDKKTCTTHT